MHTKGSCNVIETFLLFALKIFVNIKKKKKKKKKNTTHGGVYINLLNDDFLLFRTHRRIGVGTPWKITSGYRFPLKIWHDTPFEKQLNLFPREAIGPIPSRSNWTYSLEKQLDLFPREAIGPIPSRSNWTYSLEKQLDLFPREAIEPIPSRSNWTYSLEKQLNLFPREAIGPIPSRSN